ncbi:MAG: hypothetical protein V4568_18330 [Pseudomonadota bacterium]
MNSERDGDGGDKGTDSAQETSLDEMHLTPHRVTGEAVETSSEAANAPSSPTPPLKTTKQNLAALSPASPPGPNEQPTRTSSESLKSPSSLRTPEATEEILDVTSSPLEVAPPPPSHQTQEAQEFLPSSSTGLLSGTPQASYGSLTQEAPPPPTLYERTEFNPPIWPEGLPPDAVPLNPDGKTPRGALALALAVNALSEFCAMGAVYGWVLPYVLDFMEKYKVGSMVNFGGTLGTVAQKTVEIGVPSAALMLTETPLFGYGAEMSPAGLRSEIRQRASSNAYPSFKIPSHPGERNTTPAADVEANVPPIAEWNAAHEAHNAAIGYAQRHGFNRLVKYPTPGTDQHTDANLATYNSPEQVELRKKVNVSLQATPPVLTVHPGPEVVEGQNNPITEEIYTAEHERLYRDRLASHHAEVEYLNKCVLNHPYLLPPFGPGLIPPHPGFDAPAAINAYNVHIETLKAEDDGFLSIVEEKKKYLREGRFESQQSSVEYHNLFAHLNIGVNFALIDATAKVVGMIVDPNQKGESGLFTALGASFSGAGFGALGTAARLGRRHNSPTETALLQEAHRNALAKQASGNLPAGTALVPATEPAPVSTPTHYIVNDWGLKAALNAGKHIAHELEELAEAGKHASDAVEEPAEADEHASHADWKKQLHIQAKYFAAFGIGNASGMAAQVISEPILEHLLKGMPPLVKAFTTEFFTTLGYVFVGDLTVLDDKFLKNLYASWKTPVFQGSKEQFKRIGRNLISKEVEFPHMTDLLFGDDTTHIGAKITRIADHGFTIYRNSIQLPQQIAVDAPQATYAGTKFVFKKAAAGALYAASWLPSLRRGGYTRIEQANPDTYADADADARYNKRIEEAKKNARQAYITALCGEGKSEKDKDVQKKLQEIEKSEVAVRNEAGEKFLKIPEVIRTPESDKSTLLESTEALKHVNNIFLKQNAEAAQQKVLEEEVVAINLESLVQNLANETMSPQHVATLVKQLLEHEDSVMDLPRLVSRLDDAITKAAEGKGDDVLARLTEHKKILITHANEAINKRIATNTLQSIADTLKNGSVEPAKVDPKVTALRITNVLELLLKQGMSQEELTQITKTIFTSVAGQKEDVKQTLHEIEQAITEKTHALANPEYRPFGNSVEEEDLNTVLQKEIRQKLAQKKSPAEITEDLSKKLVNPALHDTQQGKQQLLHAKKAIANLIVHVWRQQTRGQQMQAQPLSVDAKKKKAKKTVNTMMKNLISQGHSVELCRQVIEHHINQQPQGTTRSAMQTHLVKAMEDVVNAKKMVDDTVNASIRNGGSLQDCRMAFEKKIRQTKGANQVQSSKIMRAYFPQAIEFANYAKTQGFTHGYEHVDLPLDKQVKGDGLNATQFAIAGGGASHNHARIYTLKPGEKIGGLTPQQGQPIEGKLTGPARNEQDKKQSTEIDKKPAVKNKKKATTKR